MCVYLFKNSMISILFYYRCRIKEKGLFKISEKS